MSFDLDPMEGLLALGVLLVGWSLYRLNRRSDVDFNLIDLLLENGKVSRIACVVMSAFLVTTWAFIYDCIKRKGVDVAIFGAYGGMWIAPLIAKLLGADVRNGNGHAGTPKP